jgi:hypothetical protein
VKASNLVRSEAGRKLKSSGKKTRRASTISRKKSASPWRAKLFQRNLSKRGRKLKTSLAKSSGK